MFAVIKTGGKQYHVKPGDVIKVEKLETEASIVSISDVLMVMPDNGEAVVGNPIISGASVSAEIMRHMRDKKIIVFKKKRRHNYRRKKGHRQWMTILKITEISTAKGE
jgi:large subunit ribosomal protein L21